MFSRQLLHFAYKWLSLCFALGFFPEKEKKKKKKETDEHKTSYLLRNTDFGTGNEKQQESIELQRDKDMV